jgi:hypothetical protein
VDADATDRVAFLRWMDAINRSRDVLIAVTSALRALENQITSRRSATADVNATYPSNVLSHDQLVRLISLRRRLRSPPPRLEIRVTTLLRAVIQSAVADESQRVLPRFLVLYRSSLAMGLRTVDPLRVISVL